MSNNYIISQTMAAVLEFANTIYKMTISYAFSFSSFQQSFESNSNDKFKIQNSMKNGNVFFLHLKHKIKIIILRTGHLLYIHFKMNNFDFN